MKDKISKIIFVVHGAEVHTFVSRYLLDGKPWWEPESSFCRKLQEVTGDGTLIRPHVWSGLHRHSSRISAAENLAEKIEACMKGPSSPRISIIGHSHGGNVALAAVNYLDNYTEKLVDDIILLATPQMSLLSHQPHQCDSDVELGKSDLSDFTGCGGTRCHWLYWSNAPERIKNYVWNVYCPDDPVQTFLARWFHGLSKFSRYHGRPKQTFLSVNRLYMGVHKDKVMNVPIHWKNSLLENIFERFLGFRELSTHSAMHSEQMAGLTGCLINGETDFNAAVEKAGLGEKYNEILDTGSVFPV